MAQPKNPPLSVRVKRDLRAKIDAVALKSGMHVNALVVGWIEAGLAADAPKAPPKAEPKKVLKEAEAAAAHLAKPPERQRHSRWNLSMVQTGPTVPPPGSRLKGATKPQRPKA